jgi:hypothetical protein
MPSYSIPCALKETGLYFFIQVALVNAKEKVAPGHM